MNARGLAQVLSDWSPHVAAPATQCGSLDACERYRQGYAMGVAEAEERLARGFEHERVQFSALASQQQLAAVEQAISQTLQQIGSDTAAKIAQAVGGIEQSLADVVAEVLAPFFEQRVVEMATDEFCQKMRDIIGDSAAIEVLIRGPRQLIDICRINLASSACAISYSEDAAFELVGRVNSTVVETALSQWIGTISGPSNVGQ